MLNEQNTQNNEGSPAWQALKEKPGTQVEKYNAGYDAGYDLAAEDYLAERVNLNIGQKLAALNDKGKKNRDVPDMYSQGFEVGYFRKLAELLIF